MTIGIGFLCTDGVVLCADRQITSSTGFKFQERKIFWSQSDACVFIFSYSGNPDAAQVMFRKVREGLEEITKAKGRSPVDKARTALERIYKDRNSKNLETLIGISSKHIQPYLFKTSDRKVVDGLADYIGCGDSSALRYLCGFLVLGQQPTVDQASVFGSYIVSVANRYVDGCSGGPDVTILTEGGRRVIETTAGILPNEESHFLNCEAKIGQELRGLLLGGGRK